MGKFVSYCPICKKEVEVFWCDFCPDWECTICNFGMKEEDVKFIEPNEKP